MRIAITIWEGRVSPVMDTAGQLLIAEVDRERVMTRRILNIPEADSFERVKFISAQQVDMLICGAISRKFEQMLLAAGVKIVPWFRGRINDILKAHLNGGLQNNDFFMPGCRRRGRRRRKGPWRDSCAHLGWRKNRTEER